MSGSVGEWLERLGLGEYAAAFVEHGIGWDVVFDLDHDALVRIGVGKTGDRLRILKAARTLAASERGRQAALTSAAPVPRAGLAALPERRQLTVMFCDLVGSTSLSKQLDPEALRDLMEAYQRACGAVVERYHGHVAQYLGDGLVTYFGWPRAHEDDAARAVLAALAIVEAVREIAAPEPLRVRVGIASGQVVVSDTGAGDASVPKMAVGETPNLASRLQGFAQPDEILVSSQTRQLVGGAFDTEAMGYRRLKGTDDPVQAWRIRGPSRHASRFDAAHPDGAAPMVGRCREFGFLRRRWAEAGDGRGQAVLIQGAAGIGKSRLVEALCAAAMDDGGAVLRLQCSPFHSESPFWPVIGALERRLRIADDVTEERKLDRLEALYVEDLGLPKADVRYVASLLSLAVEERYGVVAATPQRIKEETLRSLGAFLAGAALQQPRVLLIEDAHWIDPSTLELLNRLVDRLGDTRLFVLITQRPAGDCPHGMPDAVTTFELDPMSHGESAEFVGALAEGRALPPVVLDEILRKSDGMPLYIEALTRTVLESGALVAEGGRLMVAEGREHALPVPETLRDSLMARLDGFPRAKRVAQLGAVIGREFDFELVSALDPGPTDHLEAALDEFCASGLATRQGGQGRTLYRFAHALLQDAAYDSLLRSRQRELHGRVAEVMLSLRPVLVQRRPEIVAHHLASAGELERAIPFLLQASDLAMGRSAMVEAIALLRRGLDLLGRMPEGVRRDDAELELRVRLFHPLLARNGWASEDLWRALEPAEAIARRLGREAHLAIVLLGLHTNLINRGRVEASQTRAEEFVRRMERAEPFPKIESLFTAAHSSYFEGRFRQTLHYGEAIDVIYDGVVGEGGKALSYQQVSDLRNMVAIYRARATWILGYPDTARRILDQATSASRQDEWRITHGLLLTLGAEVLDFRGESEELAARTAACEALAIEHRFEPLSDVLVPMLRGLAVLRSGKPGDARQLLERAIATWEAAGGRLHLPRLRTHLATAVAQMGDPAQAMRLIDAAVEQIERPEWGEREYLAETLRIKGWIHELAGAPDAAEMHYLASQEVARRQNAKSWELRTSISLARLWASKGRAAQGLSLLSPVYRWFTEGQETQDLIQARELLAELRKSS